MRSPVRHILFILLQLIVLASSAQNETPDQMIESILESHLDKIEEGTDVALIIEDLEYFLEHPININATNATELARLYLLNEIQIQKLLEYVTNYGPVYSIFELKTVDGFTPDLLQKLQYFIEFGPKEQEQQTLKDQLKYADNQLLLRTLGTLQKARGYKEKDDGTIPYEGNRFRYYTRYNFRVDDKLSAGFTAEKDPGEAFFSGSNKHGFDYYSGHISFKLNETFENISVGDYLVRSGQGLVLWQGYTTGKSENVLGISKTGQGVRAYTSVDENFYFRGAAGTVKFGNSRLSLFYSHKNADGNLAYSDSTVTHFTSLQTSGYHRTESEIADEKTVKFTNAGGVFTHNFNHLKLGATVVYQHFDKPFIRSDQLYNQFRFSGTENYTAGADYLFSKNNYTLFGEAALSKSKGKAVTQGAIVHVNDQLGFSALFRHFDKDYHAFWANTMAEGSNISNESGLYFGLRFLPAKFVTLSAYSDVYQSEWFNYSTAGPARSWDIFTLADFQISEKLNGYLRFKNEEKDQKFKNENRYINLPERVQKLRLHIQFQVSETILLKTRAEHVYYKDDESENGFLLFQDIQFKPQEFPMNLAARLAWFHTESYNSRIYAYENDILYAFSIPAYYGNGFRGYLNLKYQAAKKIECWLKLANTWWIDREIISSGYNEIAGHHKTELKFQLRLKF
ncbi:helix-hairpin-helix domain-containing protein [Draconibacterium sp. IB214405]|uniref:ComEA family DNA-binding protein n=1 Tax=Draconibacterium sp. IB214405 TaxID=3097352 RepID=UPI002A0BA6B7|nr:helix-hairpin-helix domain-containing protein [Draconibacterium sp. IB214405]MDX8341426.1 helix-hairpin-helix domain-containing protein [Draconibacterium sp. IB214405]